MTTQKAQKKRATQAERQVAADLGGRKTFLSGSGDEKADVTVQAKVSMKSGTLQNTSLFSFRVEVKTTRSSGYSLSLRDWMDVVTAADKAGQAPVFVMEIGIGDGPSSKFAAIRSNFFSELTGWNDVPLPQKSTGIRSVRVSRLVRTDGWGRGSTPVRRVWFDTGNKKGDICILAYDDFLKLVNAATEKYDAERRNDR